MASKLTPIDWKYILSVLMIIMVFSGFVACGSQFYQVSVKEDFESPLPSSNPDMEDPESTLYGIHAPQGWSNIPINFQFGKDLNVDQKIQFLTAIKTWEWAVGKQLFAYTGTHPITGDNFEDLYSSLKDGVNGQYLDANWTKTKKPTYVLATTIWNNQSDYTTIAKADIRFNQQHYVIGNSLYVEPEDDRQVVDMQSLALHELGHFLGLAHVDVEVDALSIMNPSLFIGEGLTSRRLSRSDIERIQLIYGCEGYACDIDALVDEAASTNQEETFEQVAKLWLESATPTYTAH